MTSAPPDDGIIRNQAGAQALVGYIVDVGQPDGLARAILDIGPQHANRIGVLHGGIIAMLLDAACGFTASQQLGEGDPLTPLVTVSLTTQFVSAARIGSRVTAVGHASGGGKTTGFVTGALRDDDDRLIATASGVFRRIKSGRAA